jgi:predicted permease
MRSLLRFWNGLRGLLRRNIADTDLDTELSAFLEAAVAEKMRGGMSRDEAARAARLETGLVSMDSVKERMRDVGWESTLESVARDIQYAVRTLRNAPAFTSVAVLTLALGIGANTAIFGLIDALMLRQLPVHDPDQLVVLTRIQGGQSGEHFSYPQVMYLAEQDDIFAGLCGFAADTLYVGSSDALEATAGAWVTGEYYSTLGVTPIIGRLLGPEDDRPGAPPAAVITDAYWSRKFARDPDAVGQSLLIEGVPVSIVGVTPAGFSGAIVGDAADITLAIGVVPQVQPEQDWKVGPGGRWLKVLARAREGLSRDALAAGLAVYWSRHLQTTVRPTLPAETRARALSSTLGLHSGATGSSPLRTEFQRPLLVLMAAVGLLLLIACVNVANLLLARAASRDRELTLRSALGASRGRLVRQLLTESALLAVCGATVALTAASWGSNVLIQLMSTGSTGPDAANPIALDIGLNWRVLTFATLAAVVTTFLFGVAAAWHATFRAPAAAMNAVSPRLLPPGGRVARSLVAAQVAISLPLLIGAGLFARTIDNLRTLDRGFRHEDVLLVGLDARRTGQDKPTVRALYQQMLASVEQLPGVKAASLSAVTPLMGGGISMPIAVNGQPVRGDISGEMHFNVIGPRYFEVLGTPFVLGRDFTNRDDAAAPLVAIVNEAFVRQYLKDVAPLGQRVSVVGSPQEMQVVGVVGDTVYENLRQTPPPTVYAAYPQSSVDTATLEVLAPESFAQVTAALRRQVQPMLAGKPLRVRTLTGQLESGLVRERLMTTLANIFGVLALSLAVVGLYGVLAFSVARRTAEIGVRIALGARQSQVLREILGEAGRMVWFGVVIGLPIAWMASRLITSMLFGVTAHDPVTVVASVAVLAGAAFIAAFLPARRAATVDPLVAIRYE